MRRDIWAMAPQERSVYLEFIKWICKRLPFSIEKIDQSNLEANSLEDPKTKYDLLYWIGVNGVVKQVYFYFFNKKFYFFS